MKEKSPDLPGSLESWSVELSYGATTMIWFCVSVPVVMVRPPGSKAGLNPLAAGGVARTTCVGSASFNSEPAVSTSTVALGTAAPVALLACTEPETLPVISYATARITGRKLNPFRALFPRVTKLRPTSKSSVITEPFSVSAIGLSRITLIPEWPALGN